MSKPTKPARTGGVPVWAWVLGAVVFLPLVGFRLMYSMFRNPSGSMMPTLLVSDRFLVRRGISSPPRRGEVITFRFPENREQDFVKRILAVPGDTLEAIDGRPVINGWLVPHCHVGPFPVEGRTFELYVEYLGDTTYGAIFDRKLDERTCKTDADCHPEGVCRGGACGEAAQGPFKVKSGEVWVMGDNRNNSHDSRTWYGGLGGGVPLDDVLGTGQVVWLSSAAGRFFAPIHGPPTLSPEAAALKPALDRCVRDRPPVAETTPPGR